MAGANNTVRSNPTASRVKLFLISALILFAVIYALSPSSEDMSSDDDFSVNRELPLPMAKVTSGRQFMAAGDNTVKELSDQYPGLRDPNLNPDYPWKSSAPLPRIVDFEEYMTLLDFMHDVASLLESANVTYAMFFGTLLGSYRLHNMLPWDRSLEIAVKSSDLCKVITKTSELTYGGRRYNLLGVSSDFYRRRTPNIVYREIGPVSCKDLEKKRKESHCFKIAIVNDGLVNTTSGGKPWPFLHIFEFKESNRTVLVRHRPGRKEVEIAIPAENFYPLRRRPLGNLWLPAPRKSAHALTKSMGGNVLEQCITQVTNAYGNGTSNVEAQCMDLYKYYPHVRRWSLPHEAKEQLVYGSTVLHVVSFKSD